MENRYLSILMQRSNTGFPWGFTIERGSGAYPYIVREVAEGSLAALHLSPGDAILRIEDQNDFQLSFQDVQDLIDQPSQSMNLRILKNGSAFASKSNCNDVKIISSSPKRQETSQPLQAPPPPPPPIFSLTSLHQNKQRSQSDSCKPAGRSLSRGDRKKEKENFWEKVCREGISKKKDEIPILTVENVNSSPESERKSRLDKWLESREVDTGDSKNVFNGIHPQPFHDEKATHVASNVHQQNKEQNRILTDKRDFQNLENKYPSRNSLRENFLDKNEEMQGDITFWEMNPDSEPVLSRSNSFDEGRRRHLVLDNLQRRPKSFHNDQVWDLLEELTPPCSPIPMDEGWKRTNVSVKSEFLKSVSIVNKTYSNVGGVKSLKTYEHLNKTTRNETNFKEIDGKKEELVEKTEKNKEYLLANKGKADDGRKETRKVINEYSVTKKMLDGDNENCNTIKERLEEKEDLQETQSTPVYFQKNADNKGVTESPNIRRAEKCNHSSRRQNENINKQQKHEEETNDEIFPPYSEFKNKMNLQRLRKLSEDSQSSQIRRSSTPVLSDLHKTNSSDYWSGDERSPKDECREKFSPELKSFTKPQSNFKTTQAYFTFNGPFRKHPPCLWEGQQVENIDDRNKQHKRNISFNFNNDNSFSSLPFSVNLSDSTNNCKKSAEMTSLNDVNTKPEKLHEHISKERPDSVDGNKTCNFNFQDQIVRSRLVNLTSPKPFATENSYSTDLLEVTEL